MAETFTTSRIITTCRGLSDDFVEPYFISDARYLDYINRRSRELAERSLCKFDGRNYTLKIVADNPWVYIPEGVIKIRGAYSLANPRDEVKPIQANAVESAMGVGMDYGNPARNSWKTSTGTPYLAITDLDEESWRLVPIPVANDTLQLEAYVYPEVVTSVSQPGDLRDVCAQHLHLGVLASAFSEQDAEEVFDARRAAEYLGLWEREIVALSSRFERDSRASGRAVSYGGI